MYIIFLIRKNKLELNQVTTFKFSFYFKHIAIKTQAVQNYIPKLNTVQKRKKELFVQS